jgi:hypothetical protein
MVVRSSLVVFVLALLCLATRVHPSPRCRLLLTHARSAHTCTACHCPLLQSRVVVSACGHAFHVECAEWYIARTHAPSLHRRSSGGGGGGGGAAAAVAAGGAAAATVMAAAANLGMFKCPTCRR